MVAQLVLPGDRTQECQRAGCRAARAAVTGVGLLVQLGAAELARDRARDVRDVVEASIAACGPSERGKLCPLRRYLDELEPVTSEEAN